MAVTSGQRAAGAVKAQLDTHEAVCAERYLEIKETLKSIKQFLNRAVVSLISGLFLMISVILFELAKSKGIL